MPQSALNDILGPAASIDRGRLILGDAAALASARMDALVRVAVFGDAGSRELARWVI